MGGRGSSGRRVWRRGGRGGARAGAHRRPSLAFRAWPAFTFPTHPVCLLLSGQQQQRGCRRAGCARASAGSWRRAACQNQRASPRAHLERGSMMTLWRDGVRVVLMGAWAACCRTGTHASWHARALHAACRRTNWPSVCGGLQPGARPRRWGRRWGSCRGQGAAWTRSSCMTLAKLRFMSRLVERGGGGNAAGSGRGCQLANYVHAACDAAAHSRWQKRLWCHGGAAAGCWRRFGGA